MCGIVGKFSIDGKERIDPNLIQQMMDQSVHRGPDGEGKFVEGSIGMGHRRLSIIDLSTGEQPITNEDGSIWIVYNGELYNYLELRKQLKEKGHIFKTETDTEVFIHLYEEMGTDFLQKLRGMFAFALWDKNQQLLMLGRDRVGIKPLYYYVKNNKLLFASEFKSILVDPEVQREVNPRAIDRFLTYYYLPGSDTLLKDVYKLEPGHFLTVHNQTVKINKYWDLKFEPSSHHTDFESSTKKLDILLQETVKGHMISDVPVGILLSGGVDSTSVLSYAMEQTNERISTFTVGFSGEEFADERPYSKLVSQRFDTEHHEITFGAKEFADFLPKYVWHMEEPVCEPPAIALYYVSKLARDASIKVLLSGEGGDEAFGGYTKYRKYMAIEKVKSMLGPAKGLLKQAMHVLGRAGIGRLKKYDTCVDYSLPEYYLSCASMPNTIFNDSKEALYNDGFDHLVDRNSSGELTQALFERVRLLPMLNQMLYVDTKTWLPDDLLVKADKMTMATSVELRVPFLDHKVLEFAASLPINYKVQGWASKRILRAAVKDSIPKEILQRKKYGFPVPYGKWLKNEMKTMVYDTILGHNNFLSEYFDKQEMEKIITAPQNGHDCSQEVFSLLVLELWHQHFIKN